VRRGSISHKGFTLMEVLVALVILSIAFTAIFKSISSNAKNILYLENKTAANWVALNVIAGVQLKLINLAAGSQASHKEIMFNKFWYWNAMVKTTPDRNVLSIEVSVKATENSEPITHLTAFLRNES
jgi:general secretion pathway protein I